MARLLVCWLGMADIGASESGDGALEDGRIGPIASAAEQRDYSEIVIISDHSEAVTKAYVKWLSRRGTPKVRFVSAQLTSPVNFGEIHQAAVGVLEAILAEHGRDAPLTLHLSPGTPAMAAVWILLAKTRFPSAELIESSKKGGVNTASVPFDISAEYLPDLLRKPDKDLVNLSDGSTTDAAEFEDIVHRCSAMKAVIAKAKRVAIRDVPVLILGESGTGKELFAKAIHRSSYRHERPIVAVNCGAIPADLVDSELFGHEKGAFTGADKARKGYFEQAHGGTLFLDEVGELSLAAQIKLLRVLQEGEVRPVGSVAKPRTVDVRVVAATHRDLLGAADAGEFREDLLYRLGVGIIKIPALRDRKGDLGLLVDSLLKQINEKAVTQPGYVERKLSARARNVLLAHSWPGNVRELQNVLTRATIWSNSRTVSEEDIRESFFEARRTPTAIDIGPFDNDFRITEHLASIERAYVEKAWSESGGSLTVAARLLGFPNYQNFSDRIKKYGLKK